MADFLLTAYLVLSAMCSDGAPPKIAVYAGLDKNAAQLNHVTNQPM